MNVPTDLTVLGAFVLGAAGGAAHCTAMCGGIVMANERLHARQGMFQLGRALTYVLLACAVALLGDALVASGLDRGRTIWQALLGLLLIVFALAHVAGVPVGVRLGALLSPRLSALMRNRSRRGAGQVLAGMAWGMMPCMLSWPLVIAAGANPLPVAAMIAATFAAGTVLPLTALVWLDRLLTVRSRIVWNRVSGLVLVLYGVSLLSTAAGMGGMLHGDHSGHADHDHGQHAPTIEQPHTSPGEHKDHGAQPSHDTHGGHH